MTQVDLAEYLNDWLVSSGTFEDEEVVYLPDGFIYAKGDIPVCLVAHLDTVHRKLPSRIFHDAEEQILWAKEGIGGDDRCGVYAILKILEDGQKPHVLFTFDEEKGALGASVAADMLQPELNFMVEIDRRGEKDCVFYNCDNDEFTKFIEDFGFDFAWGSFSDISYLAPAWKCAAVNISAGYEDEHTDIETINYGWLFSNIGKLKNILNNSGTYFEYVSKPSYSGYGWSSAYGYSSYYNYNTGKSGTMDSSLDNYGMKGYQECDACGEWVQDHEFDQYNCLCKKCCQTFGLKTQEERDKSWNDFSVENGMVQCPKCKTWVDHDAFDEDTELCMYCVVDMDSETTPSSSTKFYQQWIDEDNDPYERYSG